MRKLNLKSIPFILVLASCSIKENRTLCDCWLTVDASCMDPLKTRRPMDGLTMLFDNDNGYSMRDEISYEELDSTGMVLYRLPRRLTEIVAVSGDDSVNVTGSAYCPMQHHNTYPRMFSWHEQADLNLEEKMGSPKPRKHHCVVHVTVAPEMGTEDGNLIIKVSGQVIGMDLWTGRPLSGDFFETIPVGEDGMVDFVIPRQYDQHEVVFSIYRDAKPVVHVNLSKLMAESGYDWSKSDLDDVSYFIENFYIEGIVKILPWETIIDGEIVI